MASASPRKIEPIPPPPSAGVAASTATIAVAFALWSDPRRPVHPLLATSGPTRHRIILIKSLFIR